MTTPPALLLVGDGTRDDDSAEAFRSFVGELAGRDPGFPVAGGFADHARPALSDTVAALVAEGTKQFAAVPLTLVPGGRAEGGVRTALAAEEERHPDASFVTGAALGPHPALLSVLERRLEEALSGDSSAAAGTGRTAGTEAGDTAAGAGAQETRTPRTPHDRFRTTVLLVGRGSTDPYANAEVHRAARLLWEGRGYAGVETAFVSLAAPDVASGLDRCRRLGATTVVVLPYFLFDGALSGRVRQQSAGWAAANREVEVRNADVLGVTEELADAVLERYREAVEGGAVRGPGRHPYGAGHASAR